MDYCDVFYWLFLTLMFIFWLTISLTGPRLKLVQVDHWMVDQSACTKFRCRSTICFRSKLACSAQHGPVENSYPVPNQNYSLRGLFISPDHFFLDLFIILCIFLSFPGFPRVCQVVICTSWVQKRRGLHKGERKLSSTEKNCKAG